MWRPFTKAHLMGGLLAIFFAHGLCAQALDEALEQDIANEAVAEAVTEDVTEAQLEESAPADAPAATTPNPPVTNTARSSVVNLQTTVTGNQEQPRVLYILPWQSPETEAIGFELLDSEQSAVFGHVERDELRRQLEAEGQFD